MSRLFIAFRIAMVIALLLCFTPVYAAENYGNQDVSLIYVHDGDTLAVNVPTWPKIIGSNVLVRIKGIDAAELHGKCQAEKDIAAQAKQFVINALYMGTIELRNIQRDKYFRLLADVYVNGENLADKIVSAGLANPYNGGSRHTWCQ